MAETNVKEAVMKKKDKLIGFISCVGGETDTTLRINKPRRLIPVPGNKMPDFTSEEEKIIFDLIDEVDAYRAMNPLNSR